MLQQKHEAADGGPASKRMKQDDSTTPHICDKHKLPLVIFCDNSDCQVIVCHTCVLLKHRDHDVIEVSEKDEELKEERKNIKDAAIKAFKKNTSNLEKLGKIKNKICISVNDALNNIEEKKKKLIANIEKGAEDLASEILEIREREMKKVDETFYNITAKNEKTKKLIVKVNSQNSIHEMISQQPVVRQLYEEGLSTQEDIDKRIKYYNTVNYEVQKVAATNILQNEVIKNMSRKRNEIDFLFIDKSSSASAAIRHKPPNTEGRDNEMSTPARLIPVIPKLVTAVKVKSWESKGSHMSSSPTGRIYAASSNTIQAFDLVGNLLMEKRVTEHYLINHFAMTCLHNNGEDKLVLTYWGGHIELRDGNTGDMVDTLRIPGFKPHSGICQDSPNTVLIAGRVGDQGKLIQCIMINNKLVKGDQEITVNMEYICGMTLIRRNNRRIVVAIDSNPSVIAIDYGSGNQLWKICNTRLNSRLFRPHALEICTDRRGHLFVADYQKGVVVMDIFGNILKEICTDTYIRCLDVKCIPNRNKLIVRDLDGIHLYDIKYRW